MTAFCVVRPRSLVEYCRRFIFKYCLHLRGIEVFYLEDGACRFLTNVAALLPHCTALHFIRRNLHIHSRAPFISRNFFIP
jgi:hypothetical protein